MDVQTIVAAIVGFVKNHQSWAIPIAFLVAFGESLCFLSLIWPGTAILVGISALIAASGVEIAVLWPAIIAAGLGGSVGYALSYWIGWYFKDSIANIWPFRSRPHLIPQGEDFFQRYGAWGVFFGHFFGPVRSVIPVVAGMFRMPQIPFQIANVASAFIWAAGVIAPAFFLVTFKQEVMSFLHAWGTLVLVMLAAFAFFNSIPTPVIAVPTLLLFVVVGAVHLHMGGQLLPALAAGALGAWVGDIVDYFRGRNRFRSFHLIYENSWDAAAAKKARRFVLKWDVLSLLPSKFHTTLRAFAPLAGGAARLNIVNFLIVSAISAIVWAGVLLAPVPALTWLSAWWTSRGG